MSKIDKALEIFGRDWITHLGNRMGSLEADQFRERMKEIINNPQGPHEYLLAALYREDGLGENKD